MIHRAGRAELPDVIEPDGREWPLRRMLALVLGGGVAFWAFAAWFALG
jgi:hypothetical protein